MYDDLEKYNKELEEVKQAGKGINVGKWFCFIIGGFSLIAGINLGEYGTTNVVLGIIFIVVGFIMNTKKGKEPILDSYFRLMLSGGDRKFPFHKSDETSVKIADFINKIEDTLTAYR